ncbi:type IV secretory system conjugative DNA transfer family protein [Devosia sp. RR2S18]|uniref:type IV secretory system conjugative DNA transfer family protein n=1 Tax=Devosia rhizosphaerae TaxID=3049774 RepID=UPI0025415CD5|nr:type IV secretion system DNA-binding domain-containing protein [Devosia sp. RR2S18]WIJ25764.1 type IV secretion system DNA-binding domain-containing protein [Devosia sp. RR2S18]
MCFDKLNVGFTPRKHPANAVLASLIWSVIFATIAFAALMLAVPIYDVWGKSHAPSASLRVLEQYWRGEIDDAFWFRLHLALLIGGIAGIVVGVQFWRTTPVSEPFRLLNPADPKIHYEEAAEIALKRAFARDAGAKSGRGIFIAPFIALTDRLERKNILIAGATGSGKSNIGFALAEQAIERGDVVVLHCTKGDVTRAFRTEDIVLLSPAHRDGWAWDIGADIDGRAAAAEFAVAVIEEAKESFFSNTARLVLIDMIVALIEQRGKRWGPRQLLEVVLSEHQAIVEMIGKLDLNASPLITTGNPDELSRTMESVLATLISGALTTLRPMAYAWSRLPRSRRFSIKAMLSPGWKGPKVLIVQSHPAFEVLSTTVCGGVLRRICQQVAAPRSKGTIVPRVTMVLDEFYSLGRIEKMDKSLSVAREQGLAVTILLQHLGQLGIYREEASALQSLFQIKIFGKQETGEATTALSTMLGNRRIAVTEENRLPEANDKRKYVSHTLEYPVFSPAQFAGELGNFYPGTPAEIIRALLIYNGNAHRIDWPPTQWQAQSEGFVEAAWTKTVQRTQDTHTS